jgi:hypothetical protein
MVTSTDLENALEKITHSYLMKSLNLLRIEGNLVNLIKVICEKPMANIILNGEILDAFPLKSRTRQK